MLLASEQIHRLAPGRDPDRTVFLHTLRPSSLPPAADFVHYNLLHFRYPRQPNEGAPIADHLAGEPILQALLGSPPMIDSAIVLVSPIEELLERGASRRLTEPRRAADGVYEHDRWTRMITETDLFGAYEDLFEMLARRDVPTQVLYSSGALRDGFAATDRAFVHHNLRGRYIRPPGRRQAERLLAVPGIQYQAVTLPCGVRTSASDYPHVATGREASFRAALPGSLIGASVLDIGCALGDFLFRAERRGATTLVGVEQNAERAAAMAVLAKLMHSSAVVRNQSFVDFEWDGGFDHVLALNVIHHVRDIDSFIAKAAKFARRRMVIEFPTLTDEKFASYTGVSLSPELNELPLIGVSGRGADQTYCFAPEALKRLVLEIDPNFGSVSHLTSPISDRSIVVFERS